MKFSELAAQFETLEETSGDCVGAVPQTLDDKLRAAEAAVLSATPNGTDLPWIYARIGRAVENDWSAEATQPWLRLLAQALRSREVESEEKWAAWWQARVA